MNLTDKVMNIVADFLGDKVNGLYLKHDDEIEESYDFDGDQDIIVFFDEESPIYLDDINHEGVTWLTGASKLVIVSDNLNYVIKIPFTHVYDKDEEGKFTIYSEANYDICVEEEDIYEQSCRELKELLVPNRFVGLYQGIPIYIQKKIYKTASTIRDERIFNKFFTNDTIGLKLVKRISDDTYCNFHLKILVPYLRKFGIVKFKQVLEELSNLNDLREDNWGFFEDGSVGIIDYGGFSSYGLFNA